MEGTFLFENKAGWHSVYGEKELPFCAFNTLQRNGSTRILDFDMIHLQEDVNLKGSTVIFPSVSIGNAGQLAVDLLITKIKPRKFGLVWHSAILPVVGGDPYSSSQATLTTSGELFYSEEWKLVIFQIRSPIMQETSRDFLDRLMEWIKQNAIDSIVILSGIFDYTRNDKDIAGPSIRFVVSPSFAERSEVFRRLAEDQRVSSHCQSHSVVVCDASQEPQKITMYGGGISWRLFRACSVGEVPVVVLMKYCSEGDNIPDANLLCSHLNILLKFAPTNCTWDTPPSWTSMFGNPPQHGLY